MWEKTGYLNDELLHQSIKLHQFYYLGGKGTGKTAIISQFLYDEHKTDYKETLEEMYR